MISSTFYNLKFGTFVRSDTETPCIYFFVAGLLLVHYLLGRNEPLFKTLLVQKAASAK